ncbi:MAG: hypothetical protein K2G70_00145 [Turicibacter sp.]|nr:hypothetical protein [Turicibacter sp.]
MGEHLIKVNCTNNKRENIYPVTNTDSVIDEASGKTLSDLVEMQGHLYLPLLNNSKSFTRLLVPESMRKTGLVITYTSYSGKIIHEYYRGMSFSDQDWENNNNWDLLLTNKNLQDALNEKLSWYKV